jgi:hypothetical protein
MSARRSPSLAAMQMSDGICEFRPQGRYSLVEAVDLISNAVAYCREQGLDKLLIDASGFVDLPMPTLLDRFLMVEDWAQAARGDLVVAMVVSAHYIHPRKFGVKVASHFGLICDVYPSEAEASRWLQETAP